MNVAQRHQTISAKAKAIRATIEQYRRLRATNARATLTHPRSKAAAPGRTPANPRGTGAVRQNPVRSVVGGGESRGHTPDHRAPRSQPSVRSIAEVKVGKPDFGFGKVAVSKAIEREGKKIGIIEAAQHESRMPHAEFKYSSKQFMDESGEVVSGSEYLGTVYGSRTVVDGAGIYTLLLSPLSLRNTRLWARCGLWNRFRFKHVSIEYIPTVASTIGGELAMALSIDPTENPFWETPNGDPALRRVMAYSNSVNFNSYTHTHMSARFTPADDEWYFIGEAADPRLEYQGQFLLQESVQPSGAIPSGGWKYGLMRVHYEVEFCGATADLGVAGVAQIVGTMTVNTNATPAAISAGVTGIPVATTATQSAVAIGTAFTPGVGVNGVWSCTVLTDPTSAITWNDAADLAVQLRAGSVFYMKTQANGDYRFFSAVPGLVGDAGMDDQLLRWSLNPTGGASCTVRYDLIALTADAPI